MFSGNSSNLVKQGLRLVTMCALLLLSSGCLANHPFANGALLNVPELVTELESIDDDEKALFDLVYLPFAHLDLKLFAQTEDTDDYPEGHTFVSVQSWLPLSLIIDGDIERFDSEQVGYEKSEFTSILWGLWSRQYSSIPTDHGRRIERNYGLLWLFDFGPKVHYERHGGGSQLNTASARRHR